jgi:hypothetical protein
VFPRNKKASMIGFIIKSDLYLWPILV